MSCRTSDHHVIPQSRNGKKTVELPVAFHRAWHTLFQNLRNDEIEEFIQWITMKMEQGDPIDQKEINRIIERLKEV